MHRKPAYDLVDKWRGSDPQDTSDHVWEIAMRADDALWFGRKGVRTYYGPYNRYVTWSKWAPLEPDLVERLQSRRLTKSRSRARLPKKEETDMPKWNKDFIREGDEVVLRTPVMRIPTLSPSLNRIRNAGELGIRIGAMWFALDELHPIDVDHRINVGDTVRKQGTVAEAVVKAVLDKDGAVVTSAAAHYAVIKYPTNGHPITYEIANLELVKPAHLVADEAEAFFRAI